VLTIRRERQAMVRRVLESLTDDQLAADVTRIEPGWPRDLDTGFCGASVGLVHAISAKTCR
jgi:hypothetical protein